MDISNIADNLVLTEGIWKSRSSRAIHYPEAGNEECRQIEETSFWFSHRNAAIVEAAKRFCKNATFFDIGGGNGFTSLSLERAGFETVLLEPGLQGVANARARGIKNIIGSTMEDAGFHKGVIPAAGLFDVIEHIEDDATFLRSIHACMSYGGKLMITVPAYGFLWSDSDDYAGHFRRYTLKSLDKLMTAVGFRTIYATYFFCFLPLPIFISRSLPTRLGLVREARVEKMKADHKKSGGLYRSLFNWEIPVIARGNSLPFGGSCLVVGSKEK